jgi:hypothetical protein
MSAAPVPRPWARVHQFGGDDHIAKPADFSVYDVVFGLGNHIGEPRLIAEFSKSIENTDYIFKVVPPAEPVFAAQVE